MSYESVNTYSFLCPHWVLVEALGSLGLCRAPDLDLWYELSYGCSSLTKERTWAPCVGSTES